MNLAKQLSNRAHQYPDSPAITADGRTISFSQLFKRVCRLAASLGNDLGIQPGDRILVFLENRREYVEMMFAAWVAGACIVPVNAKLHVKEVLYILDDSGARLLFTSASLGEEIIPESPGRGVRCLEAGSAEYESLATSGSPRTSHDTAPTDLAWIFYTSGTTGFPKGAMLSHRNLLCVCSAYYADIERLHPGMTMLHAAALSHGSGQYMLPHLLGGGHQVLYRKFDASQVLEAFATYPEVSMFAVPTMVNRLTQAATESNCGPANLRSIVYGGAPMYVSDLLRALDVFGPRLYQLYGQGETPMTISGLNHYDHAGPRDAAHLARLGTCGWPRTGSEVRVVDGAGQDVPAGEPGEIITRSDCVMLGYWNNPKATAAVLRDGWLWTGDIGAIDGSGRLELRDRSKDMVISGGSNIYPREIEEVLLQHPAVAECAVVGRPHADLGEEPVAFVVRRPGTQVEPGELDQLCLQHIARFKRPREYRFLDELPKSGYGKILKTELRRLL